MVTRRSIALLPFVFDLFHLFALTFTLPRKSNNFSSGIETDAPRL